MDRRRPLAVVAILSVALVTIVAVISSTGSTAPSPTLPRPIHTPPPATTPPPNPPPPPAPRWYQLATNSSPASNRSMMAYLPTSQQIILLDSNGSCDSSSTWAFSNGTWTNLTTKVGPGPDPARSDGGLVYDASDGQLLLFGGSSPCGVYNDTWTFSGDGWTQTDTATAPPPLEGFAMTYDAADGYVLLTGGCCVDGKDSNQTWTYEQGTWTNITRTPTPLVSEDAGMSYDATLGDVVYLGGYGTGFVSQATWTFHGGVWTRLYPAISPSNRAGMGLTYDAALSAVLVLGGYTKVTEGVYANLTDTWTYGGGSWENLTAGLNVSPPFASGPSLMSYDPASQEVVLFLGYDETWIFM